jgi:flagellar motor switch protein FliG
MSHPFENLEKLPAQELLITLDELSPQVIAIIMYFLPTNIGRTLLGQFSKEKKKEVIQKIDLLSPLNEESMLALSSIIKEKMTEKPKRIKINGQKILKNLMDNSSPELKKFIVSIITNSNNSQIKKVIFEDLDKIPDKYFQKLIKEIDRKTLLLAIKADADRFTKKLKDNLSAGAKDLLISDIRDFGAVKRKDVMEAQNYIVSLAYQLETKGILVFEDREEYIN